MGQLIVSSKIFSLGGEMWITDENENPRYQVKGSFLKFPKEFTIYDTNGAELAKVIHKMISLLPKFFLELDGQQVATVEKKFSVLRPKYEISGSGIKVVGNMLDMDFQITKNDAVIGQINKKWFSVRDKYMIEVLNDSDELLVLGIVLAIDYVKRQEAAARNSQ